MRVYRPLEDGATDERVARVEVTESPRLPVDQGIGFPPCSCPKCRGLK